MFRTMHKRSNGETFPVEVSSRKVHVGEKELVISIVRDITENVALLEECRNARKHVENLLNTANAMVVVLDLEGIIKTFNVAAEKTTGYRREEVIGKNWFEFMVGEGQCERTLSYLRSVHDPDYCREFENEILTKNGEIRNILWQSNEVREHGKITGMIGFGVDITEKIRIQELLRRKEELEQGIVAGLEFPFFVVDTECRYVTFNHVHAKVMQEIFGVDIALGNSILDYHVDAGQRETVKRNLYQALDGSPVFIEDIVGDEKISRKYYSIEHHPVRDFQRQVIGVAVFCRDISDLIKAKQEARDYDMRYRQLVEDAQVIIMAVNHEGRIGFINDFGLNLFGYPKEEILDHLVSKTILPDMDMIDMKLWQSYSRFWECGGEGFRGNIEHKMCSGKMAWIDWSVREGINPSTGEKGWLCIGIDSSSKLRAREAEKRNYERRLCNELMVDITNKRIHGIKMQERANQLGLDLKGPFVCLVIAKTNAADSITMETEREFEWNIMIDRLKSHSLGIAWDAGGKIALLLPCVSKEGTVTSRTAEMRAQEYWKIWKRFGYLGINRMGSAYQENATQDISTLFERAVAALELDATSNPSATIHHWHKLGWLRLLAQNIDSLDTEQFVMDQLEPLLTIPQKAKRELYIEILQSMLAGEGIKSVAKRIGIHSQTIRYHIKMLEKMLGICFAQANSVTNVLIATQLLEMKKRREGNF